MEESIEVDCGFHLPDEPRLIPAPPRAPEQEAVRIHVDCTFVMPGEDRKPLPGDDSFKPKSVGGIISDFFIEAGR